MSSISSIGGSDVYQQISSGLKINSAADDAAGLTIANKLEAQSNGYDVGADNAAISKDMINVADGALGSINDYLQRIRELSVQASNSAIYGDSELNAIQQEIDHMKAGIEDVAKNTQFNTKNLLDGSMSGMDIATNPNGSGMQVTMPNSTLAALGIEDFDVRGDFKISDIDKAIESISTARSGLGATSNRLDGVRSYNLHASYNLTSARSNIEDTDMYKAITKMKKNQAMDQYKLAMQKKKMQKDEDGVVRLLRG